MPARVAVLGSIVMDLVVRAPRFPRPGETVIGGPFATFPGGKGANQAVAAARLGAHVSLIGCVGDDDYGIEMLEVLSREGIDIAHVNTALETRTGIGCITVDAHGENAIVLAPGANLCVSPAQIDRAIDTLRKADAILIQLEVPIETIEHLVSRRDALKGMLILNAAPAVDIADELLAAMDVLIVNEHEAAMLAGRRALSGSGDGCGDGGRGAAGVGAHSSRQLIADINRLPIAPHALAIITRGRRGAVSLSPSRGICHHDAFRIDAVDTTGAGDAFCGALAVALAESGGLPADPNAILRFAAAAGALACTRQGAIPSMPTRDEVNQMLESVTTPSAIEAAAVAAD